MPVLYPAFRRPAPGYRGESKTDQVVVNKEKPLLAAIEYSQGIEDAWSSIASFVPKFLGFLVILVLGYFVAKAIGTIVDKALERVGFDKAVERGGIKQALSNSKYDASDIVSKVVFWTLFLFVLQLAFGVFGANPVSDLLASVIAFLPKVFVAIVIVVVASAIAAAVKELVANALGGLSYGRTLANVASIGIIVFGVFAALNQLEIAPAIVNGLYYALLAVIVGSAIVAIGGGGIQPMRSRWENALATYDEEKTNVRRELDLRDSTNATTPAPMGNEPTVEVRAPAMASTTTPPARERRRITPTS
jgi:hypothetical protein